MADTFPYRVLAAIGYDDLTDAVFDESRAAVCHRDDAELHLAHVLPPLGGEKRTEALRLDEACEKLQRYVQLRCSDDGSDGPWRAVNYHIRVGDPAAVLLELAADLGVSLMVIAARPTTRKHDRVGRVAMAAVRAATHPVLVARARSKHPAREVERRADPRETDNTQPVPLDRREARESVRIGTKSGHLNGATTRSF